MSYEKDYPGQSTQIASEDIQAFQNTSETATSVGPLDSQETADASMSLVSPLVIRESPPTPSSADSTDQSTGDQSPPATIHTITRTLKRPHVFYLRPATTGAHTLKSPSARVVSLPETVSKYSARQETSRRIVSMSERSSTHVHSDNDQYCPDNDTPARVRVQSIATDLPHTPSPPSSPDSVVFIANKSPLPAGFLQKKTSLAKSHTPGSQDDAGTLSR